MNGSELYTLAMAWDDYKRKAVSVYADIERSAFAGVFERGPFEAKGVDRFIVQPDRFDFYQTPVKATDPNADMLQKDSKGALDAAIKQLANIGQQQPKRRDPDAPREPGESLGIVAPMDGRLGRFKG